jgi:hypothetical protein
MQTMECGKRAILPVAGPGPDHARMPVMLPRESDADMRRDGSATAETVPIQPSMSGQECTAHQIPIPASERAALRQQHRERSHSPPFWRSLEKERRSWPVAQR